MFINEKLLKLMNVIYFQNASSRVAYVAGLPRAMVQAAAKAAEGAGPRQAQVVLRRRQGPKLEPIGCKLQRVQE